MASTALFAVWYFVVLEFVWPRTAPSIVLGASVCLNVFLLGLIVSALRTRTANLHFLTPARR